MRRRLAAVAALVLLASPPARPRQRCGRHRRRVAVRLRQNLDMITEWDPSRLLLQRDHRLAERLRDAHVWNPVTKKSSPRLATSWRASPDGRTWTFTSGPGVTFHTGRPLDARGGQGVDRAHQAGRDRRLLHLGRRLRHPGRRPGDRDVHAANTRSRWTWSPPPATRPTSTTPRRRRDLASGSQAGRDAGSGPYTVASWKQGQGERAHAQVVRRLLGRLGAGRTTARSSTASCPTPSRAWRMLLRGEASFVDRLDPKLFARAAATPGIRTAERPSFQTAMMLFNTATGPMTDLRVRRAVQKAVDYRGVVRALQRRGRARQRHRARGTARPHQGPRAEAGPAGRHHAAAAGRVRSGRRAAAR